MQSLAAVWNISVLNVLLNIDPHFPPQMISLELAVG